MGWLRALDDQAATPENRSIPRTDKRHPTPRYGVNGEKYYYTRNRPLYEMVEQFVLDQLDRAGLGHNTFTAEALALVVRSGEGLLRRTRNLCLGALIEAVRGQTRVVDLKQINRVLIQPHWRKDCDQPLA